MHTPGGTFLTIATIMAMQQAQRRTLPFSIDSASRSYNQIPHKHRKYKRGKPKDG